MLENYKDFFKKLGDDEDVDSLLERAESFVFRLYESTSVMMLTKPDTFNSP